MYKVLVDTNVIIDFLYCRKPFYDDSKRIIQLVEKKRIKGYITTSILMDLHYIIWHHLANKTEANKACEELMQIFEILPIMEEDISTALASHPIDFEDTVVENCALRISCNYLITRNTRHFKKARCCEPDEFLNMI